MKVFVLPHCGYKKGTMTIAFIHSFHDVLPMCSVFQTCQTVAASSKSVTPVETSYLPLIIRNTLLVYDVIFIVGPERLGPKRLDVRSPWYLSNPLTRVYWTLYPWYIEPPTHGILNRGVPIQRCTNASQYFLLRSTNRYVPPEWFRSDTVFYFNKCVKKWALHKWGSKLNKKTLKTKLLFLQVHTILPCGNSSVLMKHNLIEICQ